MRSIKIDKMSKILSRTISYGYLLKKILLLPPVIISSYTLKENSKLEDINKTLITNLQDTDIKLKILEKSIEKLTITKNEEMLKLGNKLNNIVPVLQKTEEVKIGSTSLDTSLLEIFNTPTLQTSLKLMGITSICYLLYSNVTKLTVESLLTSILPIDMLQG